MPTEIDSTLNKTTQQPAPPCSVKLTDMDKAEKEVGEWASTRQDFYRQPKKVTYRIPSRARLF